ncbi:MAG: hypothetical protein V3V88_01705 [Dehalococcoidia bacterium]|jgi:hypothetical protein
METWHWILVGIGIILLTSILIYLVLKYAYHRPMSNIWNYLFCIFLFWLWIFAIYETSRKRRERLRKAGAKEGQVIVDLGCGLGRFTILPRG